MVVPFTGFTLAYGYERLMRNEQVRKAAYRKSFNSMEIFDKVGPAFDQGVKKIVEFGKGFDHGQYLWEMRT